jgi:molybdenum cofactor biosynthesis enzyme MoaA
MLVGTMFLRPRALRALRYDCGDQVALVVSASGGAEDVAMAVTVNMQVFEGVNEQQIDHLDRSWKRQTDR